VGLSDPELFNSLQIRFEVAHAWTINADSPLHQFVLNLDSRQLGQASRGPLRELVSAKQAAGDFHRSLALTQTCLVKSLVRDHNWHRAFSLAGGRKLLPNPMNNNIDQPSLTSAWKG
jgi:hypothetical protein